MLPTRDPPQNKRPIQKSIAGQDGGIGRQMEKKT